MAKIDITVRILHDVWMRTYVTRANHILEELLHTLVGGCTGVEGKVSRARTGTT